MELWGWLIGYVVLFACLHLVLYYVYVRRDDGENADTLSFADPNRARSHSSPEPDRFPRAGDDTNERGPPEDDREFDGETVRCPHCGARNAADQTYTYCWHCISTLRR